MSLLVKGLMIALFFSLVIVGITLLPSTADYPLPSEFSSSLTLVFGYYAAWSSVFTVLNTLFICAGLGLGLELAIWIWRAVSWFIGIVARMVG